MKVTTVGAEYLLRLSNGDFGSEEFKVSVQAQLGPDDIHQRVIDELKALCKWEVHAALAKSQYRHVREAIARIEPDRDEDSPF